MGTETFHTKFPKLQDDVDYNPDYIEINQATLAEAKNENKEYVHSNGTTYTNNPKGTKCNWIMKKIRLELIFLLITLNVFAQDQLVE